MTRKRSVLLISLILGVCAMAAGLANALEPLTSQTQVLRAMAEAQDALSQQQEPGSTERSFSVLIGDGAYLGVGTEDITKDNMARYGLHEVRGVGVTEVLKDSPAEKVGLQKNDVILRFDGESVTSVRKLSRLVNESSPDQVVRLTISRAGAEQGLSATLTKRDFGGMIRS